MKSKVGIIIIFTISVAILFTSLPAMAGCSVTAWDLFADTLGADKKAAGTKLTGPLTFVFVEEETTSSFYVRLRKGMNVYQYDGKCDNEEYGIEWIDYYAQQGECIDDFFNQKIIPDIFKCNSIAEGEDPKEGFPDCPPDEQVVLKSIDMGTDQGDFGLMYIIDITVAVQD